MAELFVLSSEFEKRLHPEARTVFHDWTADIQRCVQLDTLTDDDLEFLSDYDRARLKSSLLKILECLNKCADIRPEDNLYDAYFGGILWQSGVISKLERDLMFIKWDIVPLLQQIYLSRQAKAKAELEKRLKEEIRQVRQAEEERRKKEADERWQAAYRVLKVPEADAKKYLTEPGEYERFVKSIDGAIRACMDRGKSYTDDSRAKDYLCCCDTIRQRKEREQQELVAIESAQLFSVRLNERIEELKAKLCLQKQSSTKYFQKDRRYTGQEFYDLLSADNKKSLFDTVQAMVKDEVDKLVPDELSNYISWKRVQYYHLLPSVDYALDGIPCLDLSLDTEAVVEVEIWLKPGQEIIGGYPFDLPVVVENNCYGPLQEPKLLGYYYMRFGASKLPCTFWQRMPLVLVASLADGEMEPHGVTILEASKSAVVYRIRGFENEVTIPTIFAAFLRSARGIEGIANMGIMTRQVANIVRGKLTEVKPTPTKQTSENTLPLRYSNEEFISKMAELSYSRKDSEILLQHIPRDLGLDEALKWSLEHYREIIVGNHSAGNSLPP